MISVFDERKTQEYAKTRPGELKHVQFNVGVADWDGQRFESFTHTHITTTAASIQRDYPGLPWTTTDSA